MSSMMKKYFLIFLFLTCASCTHLFYQPSKGVLYPPEQFGLKPEEVVIPTKDGLKLSAWIMRPKMPLYKSKGVILFFHGNGENMTSHYLALAWLIQKGFTLMIFDYRGYGTSEGVPNPKDIHEDSLLALDWALKENEKIRGEKFIVYGQSLGGIISARALADFKHQNKVHLLVQDSTFSSYSGIARAVIKNNWPLYPAYPLTFFAISDAYSSDQTNPLLKVPVLCVHGDKDSVVPMTEGKKNFKTFTTTKWWWEIKDGQHGSIFHYPDQTYREKFLGLLESL
jgi:alpha-beta hydrolase superfamily lysophospholipase